jgi:hypothetical protein
MPAAMAKYNPFPERRMQKITQQPPPKEDLKVAETLRQLGFNIQLLGSKKYVLRKLQTLSDKEVIRIKEAFIRNSHARFMKYFFPISYLGKGMSTQRNQKSQSRKTRTLSESAAS